MVKNIEGVLKIVVSASHHVSEAFWLLRKLKIKRLIDFDELGQMCP